MKTKNLSQILVALFLLATMYCGYSCSTDKDEPLKEPPTLTFKMDDGSDVPSTITLPSEGETVSISITSNSNWKIKKSGDNVDWLTISPQEGSKDSKVVFTISKNVEITEREATISFSVEDKENFKSFKIAQRAYGPTLFVTYEGPESIDYKGEEITFTIDSNNDNWEYSIAGNPAWIKEKTKTKSSLILIVEKNTGAERAISVSFKLSNYPSITKVEEIKQKETKPAGLSVSPDKLVMVGYSKGTINFVIDAGDDTWEYNLTNLPSWLTQKSKTDTSLELSVAENASGVERTAEIEFIIPDQPAIKHKVAIRQNNNILAADLLDVVFKADGTAEDISPSKRVVETFPNEETLRTSFNEKYNRYMATFSSEMGAALTSGFYKVDYAEDQNFQNALSDDGYTLEALFMNNCDLSNNPSSYFSVLSSQQTAGTALGFGAPQLEIRFLTSVNTGNYGWVNTLSGVKPAVGTYYHVVGVWSKAENKAYVYVNGELKGTSNTNGHYVHPWDNEDGGYQPSRWFGIGADPNKDKGEIPFIGNIVTARIYSTPVSIEDVQELWNRVK